MEKKPSKPFAAKHGGTSSAGVDAILREKLEKETRDGKLACATAFQIAADLRQSPAEIGKAADLLGIRLFKCQLGLFGYEPEKKIVQPATTVDRALQDAIQASLQNDRLPCRLAWELSERFQISKMSLSAACEALGIKVRPCQLGAF